MIAQRTKAFITAVLLFITSSIASHTLFAEQSRKADLVVFSYDRPLQLYAFLESAERYITGLGNIEIIYRVSDELFDRGYDELRTRFPQAHFIKQGANPKTDFQPLTMKATFETPAEHVLFAVDDIIVTDSINVDHVISMLEKHDAYGFYLRLGKNITWSYMSDAQAPFPPCLLEDSDVYGWQFSDGVTEWNYPNTVDMTLYKKATIKPILEQLKFANPNTFEGMWHKQAEDVGNRLGLCYERSKLINIPMNRVQDVFLNNNHMNLYSVQELLDMFNAGLKINIGPYDRIENNSPHMELEPEFILRNR